jgi:DNA-3-methyladenine glycosylase II
MAPNAPHPAANAAACKFLTACDSQWQAAVSQIGPCGLQLKNERSPYEALVRAIAYQQLHSNAAEAILGRFKQLFTGEFPTPEQVLASEHDAMRACGFSSSKVATIQGIARATLDGIVPEQRTALTMDDQELITRLTSLRGIGRWTVEMLLIFTLGRQDIFPVDDFGVREGWRILYGMDEQAKPKQLLNASAFLSPWRSTATWYLWRIAESAKRARRI